MIMGSSLLGSIVTVVFFITFVGVVIWAWNGKRKAEFDAAANLPFADEEQQGGMTPRQTGEKQ